MGPFLRGGEGFLDEPDKPDELDEFFANLTLGEDLGLILYAIVGAAWEGRGSGLRLAGEDLGVAGLGLILYAIVGAAWEGRSSDLGLAGVDLGLAGGDLGLAGGDLGLAGGDLGLADLGPILDEIAGAAWEGRSSGLVLASEGLGFG
jgi:hypothetical protein